MKKLLVISATLFWLSAFKQANAQQSAAMQKTVDHICNCLSKITYDSTKPEAFKEAAMNCFMSDAMDNYVELAQERHIDLTDQAAMRKMGEEVGIQLMKQNCQPYIRFSMLLAKSKSKEVLQDIESSEPATTGTLSRIAVKDLEYVVLKTSTTKEEDFLWLTYFDGSEKLTGDKAKAYYGKRVKISWKEIEIYNPATHSYTKKKQITSIDFL